MTLKELPSRVALPARRRKICWDSFQREAHQRTTSRPIETPEDVESATRELTELIQASLKAAELPETPSKRFPKLPARLRELIVRKRETREDWQISRCPTVKRQLNKLIEEVRIALDEHAAQGWENHIDSITDDIPSAHRLCKQLAGIKQPIQPLMAEDGLLKFDARDRAEIFATTLEEQFKPNPDTDAEHTDTVKGLLIDYFNGTSPPEEEEKIYVTPGRVQRLARRLPNRKAPGLDTIPNEALKHLPPKSIAAMTRVFNGILRSGHFPSPWKQGKVVMIPKPGKDARNPGSYRPITLLNTMSKLFERVILLHLQRHIIPREEQFGFRAEHSTTLQITRMVNEMATNENRGRNSIAVMLDMEKAFDRVWHEGLLHKLSKATIPLQVMRVLASFLDGRTIASSVEDQMSTTRPVRAGVPQGSCLSPVCYAWYTNDIPVVGQAQLALYADDAAFYVTSTSPTLAVKKLQAQLDALPEWLAKWRIAINVQKTQAIHIGHKRTPSTTLKLAGQEIPWQQDVTYLGVIIDRRLTFKKHVDAVIGRVKGARATLIPVLRSRLPLRTKLLVYKAYIRSRLTYAGPAWYSYLSATNKKRIEAQQNRTLRTIVGAPRYVRNTTISRDLRISSVEEFIRTQATNMFARADKSSLEHLKNIAPLHTRPPDSPQPPGAKKRKKLKVLPRSLILPPD